MKATQTPDSIRLLLVEDSAVAAKQIVHLLEKATQPRFAVTHVVSLHDAMGHSDTNEIDVVLLDLGLPDSAGLDTLSRMHRHTPHLPIVVLTGNSDEQTSLRALRQGAQDYLFKGQVDDKLLMRAIRYAIERKEMIESLQNREESHHALLQAMPDVVYKISSDGKFKFVNQAIERLGYKAEELLGKHFSTILHPDDVEKVSRATVLPQYAGKTVGRENSPKLFDERRTGVRMTTDLILRLIPKNRVQADDSDCLFGSLTSYGEVSASGQYQTDGKTSKKHFSGTVGIIKDITKRRRAEAEKAALELQLHQSQKMEAIGRLAGGVAHDINNVLGAILGSASVLDLDITKDNPRRGDIDNILIACRKGRDLTRDLLGFARKGKYVKEIISLNDLVMEVQTLLTRTITKKIVIQLVLDDQLQNIAGDRGQIHHALMNVCINAVDAMENQGTLIIETKNISLNDSRNSVFPDVQPGDYAAIQVRDTGIGMDAETQKKAFEPFFTTKPKGEGTGLGLSMVYGVFKNHDGIVTTDSQLGKGTTVTLCLPATGQDLDPDRPGPTKRPSYSPKEEGILVVDDEEIIRRSLRRLLEKLGYQVFTAENGKTATQLYTENKNRIALVMLDIIMPVMDGADTFFALRGVDADVKVLLFSGYSSDEKVDMLLENGAIGFLQKPFDLDTLSNVVFKALE